MADPVLAEMVHAMGLNESPHYAAVKPTIQAYRRRWVKLAPYRDGPVNVTRVVVDPAEITRAIKDKRVTWAPTWSEYAVCNRI